MVLVIVSKEDGSGYKTREVDKFAWEAAKAAMRWKENGNWPEIKRLVYDRRLHKKRRKNYGNGKW